MKKYAVIVGQGRSGTNWLLDLFNLSEKTYVCNEPHELVSSPICQFNPYRVVVRNNQEKLENSWDSTIGAVANRMSTIDPWVVDNKNYFRFRKFIYVFLRSNKIRRFLSLFCKKLANDEWEMPSIAIDDVEWKKAYRIFKFVQSPGWADFLLKARSDVHIFHIVRRPGGFLNSWRNRYLSTEEQCQVHDENLNRLRDIAVEDKFWAGKFGDIEQLGLIESELWYWFYANETIYQAGVGKSHYTLIMYEELASTPVKILKKLYSTLGLSISNEIENKVLKSSQNSRNISDNWKEKLSNDEIILCEKFTKLAAKSFYQLTDSLDG